MQDITTVSPDVPVFVGQLWWDERDVDVSEEIVKLTLGPLEVVGIDQDTYDVFLGVPGDITQLVDSATEYGSDYSGPPYPMKCAAVVDYWELVDLTGPWVPYPC